MYRYDWSVSLNGDNYIRQVNGVKLAYILFYLDFRLSVRPSVST